MASETRSSGPAAAAAAVAVAPELGNGAIWPLSVEQYHAMASAGILDDAPVELLDGYLVIRMTKSPEHSVSNEWIREVLERLLPPGWFVNSQQPLTTAESEPEPDVAVVRGVRDMYAHRHATPHDVALVVEVADSSLRRDRTLKKRIYARAGVPEYWIVNLVERRIEVYTAPTGPALVPDYAQRRDYGAGEVVPVVVEGREVGRVAVDGVLPKAGSEVSGSAPG